MSNTWIVKKLGTVDSKGVLCGIALDNNGNIYFTMGSDGLWRLNKDDMNMKPQCIVKDGSDMIGIVWNGNNILYICDHIHHRILSYSIDTGTLSILAGKGEPGHQDGNVKDATFTLPWGIAMDRNGDLYITDWDRIRKINIGSGTVETIAGPTGSQDDSGHQDGETKNAKLFRPVGIATSDDGTIYVCDRNNYCIRQIKNGVVSTLAGTPGKKGYKDGLLRDSLFSDWIRGLAITDDGSLLIADCNNNRLRKADIEVSTPQDLQVIRNPVSLTTDNEGNIYCGTTTSELWKITSVISESHIKSSLNNMTTWKHIRLFLVGDCGAGKTSLVRWLKGEKFNPNHMSTDSVEVSTTDANTWQPSTFDIKDYMADIIFQPDEHLAMNEKKYLSGLQLSSDTVDSNSKTPSSKADIPAQKEVSSNSTQKTIADSDKTVSNKDLNVMQLLTPTVLQRIEKAQQLSVSFHVWDFAGQEEYYNTHHFFLSEAAIYLLVIDISKPIDMERISFWLDSIKFYAESSPVILVGTHKDCLKVNGILESAISMIAITQSQNLQASDIMNSAVEKLKGRKPVQGAIAVSTKLDSSTLIKKLLEDNLPTLDKCKLSWLLWYDNLSQGPSNSLSYILMTQARKMAATYEMNEDEVKKALNFYHKLGFILYFGDDPVLQNIIFIKPQQLVGVFKTVITALGLASKVTPQELSLLKQEGRMSSTCLKNLWSQYPSEIHLQLRTMLHKFGLAFDDPAQTSKRPYERDLILPYLVEAPENYQLAKEFEKPVATVVCSINTLPPLGYANRLIAKTMDLVGDVDSCCVFKGGCIFQLEGTMFRIKTSPGQVIIEGTQKILDNSPAWIGIQKILYLVHSTAISLKKTAEINTESICFLCNKVKVIVNIQKGIIDENAILTVPFKKFCCPACRGT